MSQLTPEPESRERRDDPPYELDPRYEPYGPSDWGPVKHEPRFRILRKLAAPFIFIGVMFWKFKFVLAAIFKFKVFTVAGSMIVSVAAYALLWGWQFAVGFVLLLFVHEMGHALEAKRQGIPVSAPLFIPFLGAVIAMKQMPHDVWKEAQIAIAGPILGTVGCVATWGLGEALDSELLIALAFTGFFLNLFNLAPITPLDGGRIVAAIHPAIWALGLVLMIGLVFVFPNPILILILLLGGYESWKRFKARNTPESRAFHAIPTRTRVLVAVVYLGLAAALAVGVTETFLEKDFDDV